MSEIAQPKKGTNQKLRENPFVDLGPEERFQIVYLRLARLKELVLEVIALNEQRKAVVPSFDRYWEAPPDIAVTTFVLTMIQFEISHVCRLWDRAELGGYGLPSISALLDSPDVLDLVAKKLREQIQAEKTMPQNFSGSKLLSISLEIPNNPMYLSESETIGISISHTRY